VNLTDAFTAALTGDTTPPPRTGPELVRYGGGAPALARIERGLPPTGNLPSRRHDPERRRLYDNALRKFQRWAAPAGKQRTKNPDIDDLRHRLIISRRFPLIPDIGRLGARVRITALVRVDSPTSGREDVRVRVMPAGGSGKFVSAPKMRALSDLFMSGDADAAAEDFIQTFLSAYDFPEAEIEDIQSIKIWPDGTPEP
jgi:hypothetical protein